MRKLRCICGVLMMLLAAVMVSRTVRADVIYVPRDDFYMEHYEECVHVNRSYHAKGPDGALKIYTDPVTPAVEATVDNGTRLQVSFTYLDSRDIQWGCVESWELEITGWAPMEYLSLIYDGISFEEEFADQIRSEEGSLDKSCLGQTIYFWQYPGSSDYLEILMPSEPGANLPQYNMVYTDDAENTWGKCGYYRGLKGYWINLTDSTKGPSDQTEPVPAPITETEAVTLTAAAEEIVPVGKDLTLVLTLCVASVVAVTAAALVVLKKRGK